MTGGPGEPPAGCGTEGWALGRGDLGAAVMWNRQGLPLRVEAGL